jgi:tRNA pseudouridine38/39 synthase
MILKKQEMTKSQQRKNEKRQKAASNAKLVDFAQYAQRRMAFRFSYIGANYGGLVVQTNEPNTVEQTILTGLQKVCLIDPNDQSSYACCLNRCGRTDKGVSALGNVLSINLRHLPTEDYL